MRRACLALALVASVVSPGCLRTRFDRCADDPPHPECPDAAVADAGSGDAGAADAAPSGDDAGAVDAGGAGGGLSDAGG